MACRADSSCRPPADKNADVPSADTQCDDHRRGGLLPGLGLRPAHLRAKLGSPAVPGGTQHRSHPRPAGRGQRQGHIFHPGLDRRALPAHGARHRRQRPRTRQPRLRPSARVTTRSQRNSGDDITRSKTLLEDLGGKQVIGYRAPSFSIGSKQSLGAGRASAEAGYRYSSSIYPIRHDHYGMPDAPRFAHYPRGKDGLAGIARHHRKPAAAATCLPAAAAISAFCPTWSRAGFCNA